MIRYISTAETAKLARVALKAAFPGVKFSVRGQRGRSLQVTWTDGPSTKAVDAVVGRYAGEGFDGMTDLRYSVDDVDENGEKVSYLTSFVFTTREVSDDAAGLIIDELIADYRRSGVEVTDVQGYYPVPQLMYREGITYRYNEGNLREFVRVIAEHRAA